MQALSGRLILSPSDLNDYVECPHLTTLALEVARGTRTKPFVLNEHGDLLRRKGDEHEAAFLDRLRAEGRQVVNVIGDDRWDFDASARKTIEAMRAGADVIYQATFVREDWRGRGAAGRPRAGARGRLARSPPTRRRRLGRALDGRAR